MEDYIKSVSLYGCDIVMVEPVLYDQFYSSIKKINSHIQEIIEERIADEIDGEIYSELIKDLQVNEERPDRFKVNALPLFLDYGILYYRSDIIQEPPKTWKDLVNAAENLNKNDDFRNTNTIYIGQFNEYREFFYDFIENVLNTEEPIDYSVFEKESYYTLSQFNELFKKHIIDEYASHLNSEYGVIRFNDGRAAYMRNWSSNLYDIITKYRNMDGKTVGITKTLYSDERSESSRAINKGVYICVTMSNKEEDLDEAIEVVKTFSSKDFMQHLLQKDIFYDLPAYHSLILEDKSIDNENYCNRINCEFFRDLAKDHIVATYSIFYQRNFLNKFSNFFEISKSFFKEYDNDDSIYTLESLMLYFEELFKEDEEEKLSCNSIITEGQGHYFENSRLYYHDDTGNYPYKIPLPGFYMNICKTNECIQCSSATCQSISFPNIKKECNASTDGKLIKTGKNYSICTKINQFDTSKSTINLENYISIPFTASEHDDDRYLIHHAGEVFNFDHTATTTYYVVRRNATAIVFDPTFESVKDHCANTSGLMVDRVTDFCSSDSSGMYYTCTNGKCTSEYQTKKEHFEDNGENSCNCTGESALKSCGEKDIGYYYETDTLYFYNGKSCSEADPKDANLGFYFNGYQNQKISQFDGQDFSPIIPEIVTSNYCEGKKNEMVNSGFGLVFCNGDGQAVSIQGTKDQTVITKGIPDTLFSQANTYYTLNNNGIALSFDNSKSGKIIYDGNKYICNEGLCIFDDSKCIPESSNDDERKGCDDGYYLVSEYLYYCNSNKCGRKNIVGYFKNAITTDYIKCTSEDDEITCEKLKAPKVRNNKCNSNGNLIYVDGTKVKLCLDSDEENAIEIFTKNNDRYLLYGRILNESLSKKYYLISISENAVIPTKDNKSYLFTFEDFKVINLKKQKCESEGHYEDDLIEFKRDITDNTYMISND